MVYTRPAHGDPFADGSATDATIIVDALADGLEAVEAAYLSTTTAASTYAPIASPTLTGVPAAPTAAVATDTTQLATTAFVGLRSRVTHPNTDDVLVQVWDVANARWQVAWYDSGWRETSTWDAAGTVTGIALSGTAVPRSGTAGWIRLRRVGYLVTVGVKALDVGTGSAAIYAGGLLPAGFLCNALGNNSIGTASVSGTGKAGAFGGVVSALGLSIAQLSGQTFDVGAAPVMGSYLTADVLPASLPGTLVSAAPYA